MNTGNIEITVTTDLSLPVERVWELWTRPEHIVNWNYALSSWHTPSAENDLSIGGRFSYRMEARDGSMGFDFSGSHTAILPNRYIFTTLDDARSLKVFFSTEDGKTRVTEIFDAEKTNPPEMQKKGWQAILDNFKKYAENQFI